MGKPEGAVEQHLRDECDERDILCWKFISPSISGVPDRILIGQEQVIFAELKSEKGVLSEKQKRRIPEMREHGAIVYVLDNKTDIDALLASLCKPVPTQKEVLSFIKNMHFSPKSKIAFTSKYSYWFAVMLHERFPCSRIMYDTRTNRFAVKIADKMYDINGVLPVADNFTDWTVYRCENMKKAIELYDTIINI